VVLLLPPCLLLLLPPRSIQQALLSTIAEGKYRTRDLGGSATTTDFTKAVIDKLE
jgi:isocitrate dehydrogenase (NAD+)